MSIYFRLQNLEFNRLWLVSSCFVFVLHIIAGLLLVMLFNGKWLNHMLTPIFQYVGMFKLIWPEQPFGAIQFLATKSLFAFAHQDPRSGLNLWTLEYDSITLLIYLTASVLAGWAISKYLAANTPTVKPSKTYFPLVASLTGIILLTFSVSYMTVIEHCSGATWAGFVMLYGLGFDELELYYAYQVVSALIGILAITWGLIIIKNQTRQTQP